MVYIAVLQWKLISKTLHFLSNVNGHIRSGSIWRPITWTILLSNLQDPHFHSFYMFLLFIRYFQEIKHRQGDHKIGMTKTIQLQTLVVIFWVQQMVAKEEESKPNRCNRKGPSAQPTDALRRLVQKYSIRTNKESNKSRIKNKKGESHEIIHNSIIFYNFSLLIDYT